MESWTRGAEPFLLVDRIEICLVRVLRWSRPINGPREKGAASVTRIHSWVSDQFGSFSFLPSNRLNFFPSLEIDPLHILKQHTEREEGRASREGAVRRDKERSAVRKKKGNGILQSPCRKPTYGLVQWHPDTHPLYIDPYVVDVNKLYSCICICIYILCPCVWCIRVCVLVS